MKDYALSFYCAEVCNVSVLDVFRTCRGGSNYQEKTATNVLFVWLGIKGIRNCIANSHPAIFIIAFIGYIMVGIGSVSFHATLKCKPLGALQTGVCAKSRLTLSTDPMQLVDELSMIYTTCLMMYASFSFSRSKVFSVVLGAGLLGLAAFITVSPMQAISS